ncbi:sialidase family protein [Paenibacillus koleovorans]|uniref:sialidase family protein n=1 Tax=Paenibacillus koleovorans TaxID=121608 RepID=UPI000FDBFF93|nr:sialidase family protein [Paenibacillus koleovorans]
MQQSHMALPLAQDYTTILRVPESEQEGAYYMIIDPAFIMLPDGKYLTTVPVYYKQTIPHKRREPYQLHILLSEDKGSTWHTVNDNLPYTDNIPFYFEGRLYLFFMAVPYREADHQKMDAHTDLEATLATDDRVDLYKGLRYVGIHAIASDDHGKTWTEPVEVIKGTHKYSTCQMPMVVKDGTLYWAISEGPFRKMAVASCNLQEGVLNPAAWRITEGAEMVIPKELNPGLFPGPSMHCLEGNVVEVGGRLRVLARAVIDRQGTANIAAAFDIALHAEGASISFTQFVSLPGGQCKFYIVYDDISKLYWMASNVPSNSQNLIEISSKLEETAYQGTVGNDRRYMMLWYACDALNWFPAGCIAKAEKLTQSFMYPSVVIDGDDLVITSRTSHHAVDQHDADLVTLHRVRDFRALAMDIWPVV